MIYIIYNKFINKPTKVTYNFIQSHLAQCSTVSDDVSWTDGRPPPAPPSKWNDIDRTNREKLKND